jgi:hypothetical protein
MATGFKDLRVLLDRERTASGQLRGAGRRAVVELVEALHAGGASYREIADGVGVEFHTLMSWRYDREPSAALLPVRVSVAPPVRTIAVHGPHGLRIEGLSLDELATLLLRLSQ